MDGMAAAAGAESEVFTKLRKVVAWNIKERDVHESTLRAVYGTSGDGFPSHVSIRKAATYALTVTEGDFAIKDAIEQSLIKGEFERPEATVEVLRAFAVSIVQQDDAHQEAVRQLKGLLAAPKEAKSATPTAEAKKEDPREAINGLVGKDGDELHQDFVEAFDSQNFMVPREVHLASMAEMKGEEERKYVTAIRLQGAGKVPQAWKEGPGWGAIKAFIERVAVAQLHALAESFTGKPVNKDVLTRAVANSSWELRGRSAAEATGRAIATMSKTDRQNAGHPVQRLPPPTRDRPVVHPQGQPRTYTFPRHVTAGAVAAAVATTARQNATQVANVPGVQLGPKCHNCGQHGHLIAACTRPTKCYACQGDGHRSDQCPMAKRLKKG